MLNEHFFVIVVLLFLVLINRKFGLSLLSPSIFLIFIWLVFYSLHLIIGDGMFISYLSIMYILLYIISFNIGELLFILISKNKVNSIFKLKKDNNTKIKLERIILISSLFSLVASLLYARCFVNHFGSIASYLVADIRHSMVNIYIPFWIRIPLLFSYSVLLISIVYYYVHNETKYMVISIIPILIMSVVQNGRAGILMIIVMIVIALLLKNILKVKRNNYKIIIKYGIYLITFGLVIFIGGAIFRYRNMETTSINFFINSFRSYLLGGMSAFDTYIHNPITQSTGFGKYSFSALYDLLGIANNEFGVYTKYLPFNVDGDTTNIFTAFRQMIDDFGKTGAALYMFILGIVARNSWIRIISGDDLAIAFIVLFYMYLFHIPLLAVTVHNSILFSFIIPVISLIPFSKKIYIWKR